MVFESGESWDVLDRFDWVTKTTRAVFESSSEALLGTGDDVGLFNPLNWKRSDPVVLQLPAGRSLKGLLCEALPDGSTLCRIEIPSVGFAGWKLSPEAPTTPRPIELPDMIETNFYLACIDSKTGDLVSLKLKKSGRELIAAPANVIVAERPASKMRYAPGDSMLPRPERARLATSSDWPASIQTKQGPLALTVVVSGTFWGGGEIRRVIRFYRDYPRIDFETELNDISDHTVVVAEFPLAEDILEVRRGIPYGFSHGAWSKPDPQLHGSAKGIVPTVRWIDFSLANGGGVAILDRGLTGRELNQRTPIIYLLNAEDKYYRFPNPWLTGKGRHRLHYSFLPHEEPWDRARVPHMAWEYNREPEILLRRTTKPERSYVQTSDNIIVETLRREGNHMELRFVECLGRSGTAAVELSLPHRNAVLTDLAGRKHSNLPHATTYHLRVRPQQIVTMHFETSASVLNSEPITAWDQFVPAEKIPALHQYDPDLKGFPSGD